MCCLPVSLPNCHVLVSVDTLSAPPNRGPVGSRQATEVEVHKAGRLNGADWDGL